jgi:hypothetical protein
MYLGRKNRRFVFVLKKQSNTIRGRRGRLGRGHDRTPDLVKPGDGWKATPGERKGPAMKVTLAGLGIL